MKKFWTNLKDICYSKETGVRKGMTLSVIMVLAGLSTMGWFLIRLLKYEGHWNPNHFINLVDAGLIGDFIGGLSGTLFALVGILLLFETLSLQRNEFIESRKVFEKQQFETTYFNLINLYQEVVKSLHFEIIDESSERRYNGKDFFEQQRKKFYEEFIIQDLFGRSRKQAKIKYIEFYTLTKEQTSHYFRTLYRIFKFIYNSKFNEEEKMHYAKIVRAQLSESELFFIHYNAYSEYGVKFRMLINQFNILKHLPYLEKVEYKEYTGQLGQMEKNSVGLVLDDIKALIKKTLKTNKICHKTYLAGSIDFKIIPESNYSFSIQIIKREDLTFSTTYQQGLGLNNFNLDKTELFILDFLNDLLLHSNYFEYNGRDIVITSSKTSNENNNKHKITISISDRLSNPIKFN